MTVSKINQRNQLAEWIDFDFFIDKYPDQIFVRIKVQFIASKIDEWTFQTRNFYWTNESNTTTENNQVGVDFEITQFSAVDIGE